MKKFIIATLTTAFYGLSFAVDHSNSINLPIYQYKLKDGKGKDLVEAYCQMCHSVGYILNNAGANRHTWEHIVNHMIKDFKAPIDEKVAKQIVEYLTKNYGKVETK